MYGGLYNPKNKQNINSNNFTPFYQTTDAGSCTFSFFQSPSSLQPQSSIQHQNAYNVNNRPVINSFYELNQIPPPPPSPPPIVYEHSVIKPKNIFNMNENPINFSVFSNRERKRRGKYKIHIPFLSKESEEDNIREICKNYHSITKIDFKLRV